jgi:predicted unusual protein kinase regulating ubiquinone biosynthesis (AarF/ABC1/UbiB family)
MDTPQSSPGSLQPEAPASALAPPPDPMIGRRDPAMRFSLRACGVESVARLLWFVVQTVIIEAIGRLRDLACPPPQAAARREARRASAASRLAAVLGNLKGPFIKAGQFAAVRYDVLPGSARRAFEALTDRASPVPFAEVRATVEAELGALLASRFSAIDPVPLGTASIAQAHRARLPDGREVVVKVQHPGLADALHADLALLRWLLNAWLGWRERHGRPVGVDGRRLFDEFADGIADEFDFRREATIAREIAANLATETRVVVPEIVDALTTRRVLTMQYYPAIPILDRARLEALGVRSGDVLEVLARAYAKQIFVDGLFHADPHPGNLFVIDEPEAATAPRVLFVDFGLSKRLSPELRRALRKGILALLQRDVDGFVARMHDMHIIAPGAEPGVRAAVGAMLDRLGSRGGPLGLGQGQVLGLKDEAKRLLQETPGLQLPNDLLLYARTLSYLFALGEQLDPGLDLMKLSVPYLLRFLATQD